MNDKTLCDGCFSNRFFIDFPRIPGSRDELVDHCIFCIAQKPELYPGGLRAALSNMHGFSPKATELAARYAEQIDMNETTEDAAKLQIPIGETTGEIVAELDRYIIGQTRAKRVLAIALRNHLVRQQIEPGDVELKKSNVLLLGPTGSGKTAMVNRLAKIVGVDVIRVNATEYTEAGYVGKDVEKLPELIFEACNKTKRRAENAIVYIDEIDKKRSLDGAGTRDVSGAGVQQAFLKLVEGGLDDVPFDVGKTLFIFSGAFAGITDIIRARLVKEGKLRNRSIGFTKAEAVEASDDELLAQLTNADLCAYGMVPEFSGRVPAKAVLSTLTESQLVEVLRDTANSPIRQLEIIADAEGCALTVTEEALRWVARAAIKRGTGARALEEVLEETLEDYKFNQGNGEYAGYAVTIDVVDNTLKAIVQ